MIFSIVVAAASLLGQGDAAVIGALLASLTAVAVAWFQGNKAAGAATSAAALISTNQGTRPGEYLEMIGDIQATLAMMDGKVDHLLGSVVKHDLRLARVEGAIQAPVQVVVTNAEGTTAAK